MNLMSQSIRGSAAGELILTNARIVTADAVVEGSVVVRDGIIAEVDERRSTTAAALDLEGDYLLPGLVELHTDNLERHIAPRPGVFWPPDSAVLAHDAEIAAAGITTVLDALRLGALRDPPSEFVARIGEIAGAVRAAGDSGQTRAEHLFHIRCEISGGDVVRALTPFLDNPHLRLISVMDHTPGQRQFVNLDKYKEYFAGKYGMGDVAFQQFFDAALAAQERYAEPNRRTIVGLCRERDVPLASHDDATPAHVEEAVADGAVIAEFPTTVEAAGLARDKALNVLMGAPNVVRGGSHSGNVSALDLARGGMLDILSSDYIPSSLMRAAFRIAQDIEGIELPEAVAVVTLKPAHAVGLHDRGEIAVGKRADLVWVHDAGGLPVVRSVWREGRRVI